MEGKELIQKLHEAIDLINRAKDIGCEAEVNIVLTDGAETLRLSVSDSVTKGDYYLTGRYTPEGGRDGEH